MSLGGRASSLAPIKQPASDSAIITSQRNAYGDNDKTDASIWNVRTNPAPDMPPSCVAVGAWD
jgi:hypothetical protein